MIAMTSSAVQPGAISTSSSPAESTLITAESVIIMSTIPTPSTGISHISTMFERPLGY